MKKLSTLIFPLLGVCFLSLAQAADNKIKTFVLAQKTSGDLPAVVAAVKQKLTTAGFEVVGEYSPYASATIILVTNDALKKNAASSEFGAFGAAQRITVTRVKDEVQVAFTNPTYMAHAYRMKNNLADVTSSLKAALGDMGQYGPEEGLSSEDLRDYQYKWLMPYFTNRLQLVKYGSQSLALDKVEAALANGNKGGVKKVYRVDVSDDETVIGVNMSGPDNVECSGDKYIMERIDFKAVKSTGHLPYEIVIRKGTVYALPAEFRIAISFPDLSMVGSNSFASIMCAPNAIETALTLGSGGKMQDGI